MTTARLIRNLYLEASLGLVVTGANEISLLWSGQGVNTHELSVIPPA
ncbi:MAG: hypothetical protein RBT49_06885 [Bacteroidales bacterium]|nr:hypothetical protein [Bacteroidales bacterium]